MAHPFDSRAWDIHINRLVATWQGHVATLLRDIRAGMHRSGLTIGWSPRASEPFLSVTGVVDGMLDFERKAAEYEAARPRAGRTYNSENVFSEAHEKRLLDTIKRQLDGLATQGQSELDVLRLGQLDHFRDLAQGVESRLRYRIRRTYAEGRADIDLVGRGRKAPEPQPKVTSKRSTVKGEAREKIIAALTQHHKYQDGGCLNLEPIGVNELAGQARVSGSSVSEFFKRQFKGHKHYMVVCRDAGRLAESLKVLNGEFSPLNLYGRNPTNEGQRGGDD